MKIFGHPVHLMLIHFPSALFPMDLMCAFLADYTGNDSFRYAAFCAMTGGVVFGWLAAIAGMLDLGKIAGSKQSSVKKALIHGGINTVVLIVFTLFVMMAFKKYPQLTEDSALILIVKTCAVMLMVAGNFIGGSLVLKDKVLD